MRIIVPMTERSIWFVQIVGDYLCPGLIGYLLLIKYIDHNHPRRSIFEHVLQD